MMKIHYIKIPVTDIKTSTEWYANVLGLHNEFIDENEGIARLNLTEGPFIILVRTNDGQNCNFTKNKETEQIITFTNPNVHELYHRMNEQNVRVSELDKDDWSVYFKFYDPDGNMFLVHS